MKQKGIVHYTDDINDEVLSKVFGAYTLQGHLEWRDIKPDHLPMESRHRLRWLMSTVGTDEVYEVRHR